MLTLLVLASMPSYGQGKRWVNKNNPNYDERKISYGFMIGLHSSALQLEYSDQFVTQDFDTLYAVQPSWSAGFSLGFIVNYRAAEFLDLRLTPKVSFYEHKVRYVYTNAGPLDQLIETTMVEFPFLAKYKSVRRGNVRMYVVGGITPGVEASGKKDLESTTSRLELKRFNLSLEGGFGFDLYYPLFKFSPEIRFSRGMLDLLGNRNNIFGQPLGRVSMNTVTVYLLFQ
jgi:Outer membrane protein beta-barrel domain